MSVDTGTDWTPWVGLGGAALGSIVTYAIAFRGGRVSHNAIWQPRQIDYLVEVMDSANNLYLVLSQVSEERDRFIEAAREKHRAGHQPDTYFRLSDALAERNRKANAAWRRVLAARNIFASEELRTEMRRYDNLRARVVEASNKADRESFRALLDELKGPALVALTLAVSLLMIQQNLIMVNNYAWGFDRWRRRRQLLKTREAELKRYEAATAALDGGESPPPDSTRR